MPIIIPSVPKNFEWIVDAVAEFAVEEALKDPAPVEMRWAHFLTAAAR